MSHVSDLCTWCVKVLTVMPPATTLDSACLYSFGPTSLAVLSSQSFSACHVAAALGGRPLTSVFAGGGEAIRVSLVLPLIRQHKACATSLPGWQAYR